MRISRLSLALTLAAALSLDGCPTSAPASWSVVAHDLHEALLSITGTSATNVWAVGADLGAGPIVLHYDGTSWARVPTATRGTLWWAQAFADGTLMAAGAQSSILRSSDGITFTRMQTPGLAGYTVFGLWGSSPSDVYAVGSVSSRNGFVWHFDGTSWQDVPVTASLPLDTLGDAPGFFKVWGDGHGRVYVVGGRGVILRREGAGDFERVDSGVTDTIFTVTGNADRAVFVGGASAGLMLEASASGAPASVAPAGVALVQGVAIEASGHGFATGFGGLILERRDGAWSEVSPGVSIPQIQSLHATWIDPSGGAWAVGGNVLSSDLDHGIVLHFGAQSVPTYAPTPTLDGGTDASMMPVVTCPMDQIDPAPTGSIARRWNEQNIGAIRRDLPRPGVHARNLFHVSAAMWDAWASYQTVSRGVFFTERNTATDVDAARREAISYAAYGMLVQRYAHATGGPTSMACMRAFMTSLGYDPDDTIATGDSPRAVGNRIAAAIIAQTIGDGANESANYADTTMYSPVNLPLVVDQPGVMLANPNHWQELNLALAETQNGIVTPSGVQGYIGSNWGGVTPFAMTRPGPDMPYHDPGPAPQWDQPEMQVWIADILRRAAALDHTDGQTIDTSPATLGNDTLGTDDGHGWAMNPVTMTPYAPQVVPRGDYARVLAEFWADGPRSETPPGHWFVLANGVADAPSTSRRLFGMGTPLDALAWDVHVYLALGGAVHDAAITAWELKRRTTGLRPISTVRYMAQLGQSTETSAADYDVHGLPLVPGVIERITAESAATGQRHAHLHNYVGQLAVYGWRGEPGDRAHEVGGVAWIRAIDWIPYQRRTFVTPAFPGYTSGHSTFSRASAEVLAALTGSPYFPGGMGEFVAHANAYLVFEDGPSVDVHLQWASYYDAADQAGQSRVFGGIHLVADDYAGRLTGSLVGIDAVAHARTFFDGM